MRIIIVSIIFLFYISICNAQWIKFASIKNPTNTNCDILEDLSSHSKENYYSNDTVNAAHELCHFVNSDIRNKLFRQGYRKHNTFYVLNNVAYLIKEPNNLKLSDIAKSIPTRYRGQVYNLYLIQQQRDWNDTPSYILDEHVAYTIGTMCGIEINDDFRTQDSGHRMIETLIYCHFLKRLANQPDINKIVDWQTQRIERLYKSINVTNPKMIQNYNLLQEIK